MALSTDGVTVEATYPLSAIQQGMLFRVLYEKRSGVDIEQLICTIHCSLSVTAFLKAWQQVTERYAALRTSFCWQTDEPCQQVHSQVELPVEQQNWCHFSHEEQQERLNSFLRLDRQRGFDLAQAPLMRLAIFQLAPSQYQCVWTFHHILLDGRSIQIVLGEVFAAYEALRQGQKLTLPPVYPYQDYITWLQEQDFSNSTQYWKELLKGFTTPTSLPTARIHAAYANNSSHHILQASLSESTTAALKHFADKHDLTPNTILQGAWALLLSHYNKVEDVVFGATRACRYSSVPEANRMVGILINTLPVRVQPKAEKLLLPWLQELRNQHLAVRPYEHTPLVQVQAWSDVPAILSLFESLVVFENRDWNTVLPVEADSSQKIEFQLVEQPSYPLVLLATLDAELVLKLSYDSSQFEEHTIAQWLERLQSILEQIIANPERQIGELSFLTTTERHQILVEWNATEVNDYPDLCLHHLFEAQVKRCPDAIAVVCNGQRLSYAELNNRADQLANYLQAQGVKPEVTVGICLERSIEMVVSLLGVLKAGGAYVPLDPTYPAERLNYLLVDSNVSIVLTQAKLLLLLSDTEVAAICLDQDWHTISTQPSQNLSFLGRAKVTPSNLAYIIYTSGSTGQPKGVLIEHRGAVNTILDINRRFHVTEQDRVLAVCSLNFDLSVYDIFGLLGAGGTIVLPRPSIAPDLSHWADLMQREQVTLWNSAPPLMQAFAGYLMDQNEQLPASLRLVLLSGDWIALNLPEQIRNLQAGEPVEIISLGGATEASIWSIFYPIREVDRLWNSIPYGKPLGNQRIYVVDEQLQLVAMGQVGEICIGGAGVARGYLNRSDLTTEKFVPDPFQPGSRLYRTGDLGRYGADGNIELLGRIDQQVKIRGFRVEIGEIESVLLQHSAIRECAVLLREDDLNHQQLVAYLVGKAQDKRDSGYKPSALREFLQEKLPDYMVPSTFVWLEHLPLTPNGKLDRQALLSHQLQFIAENSQSSLILPCNETEQQLLKIWQDCLNVSSISTHDSFFELGGHSLLALRLWSKVQKAFNCDLPLATLFQAPTIAQLAERLHSAPDSIVCSPICPSLVVIQAGKPGISKPPLFCIHVLGKGLQYYRPLLPYLDPDQPVYGLSTQAVGEAFPSNQVKDLADHYIQQIRQIQPQEPYCLIGYSFGGLIAFEMARKLTVQGQKVSFLGLIDTYWSGSGYSHVKLPSLSECHQVLCDLVAGKVTQAVRRVIRCARDEIRILCFPLQTRCMFLIAQLFRLLRVALNPELQHFMDWYQDERSACNYFPQAYAGQITLFRAAKSMKRVVNPLLGWAEKGIDGVLEYIIPGNHHTIFTESNVQILGSYLSDRLTAVNRQEISKPKFREEQRKNLTT